jgi:hypothetical protein
LADEVLEDKLLGYVVLLATTTVVPGLDEMRGSIKRQIVGLKVVVDTECN